MLRRAHIDSPHTRQPSGIRYAVIAHSAFAGRSHGCVPESTERAYMASRVKVRLPPSSFSVTTSSPSNQDRSCWTLSSAVAPGESGRWKVRGYFPSRTVHQKSPSATWNTVSPSARHIRTTCLRSSKTPTTRQRSRISRSKISRLTIASLRESPSARMNSASYGTPT